MVKDIHKRYLKQKYSYVNIKKVKRIGIDEFAVRKGHVYKTIVVDLDTGHIIYVGDGKGSEALDDFWKRVKRHEVEIELVTSDMSAAYIYSVITNAPNATHVYDKFHVVKLVHEAVDKVRRSIWKQETDLEKRDLIKGTRWMLLSKNLDKFDDKQKERFHNILATNEPLFKAYYLKEDIDQIWMQPLCSFGRTRTLS
jgi:transposase